MKCLYKKTLMNATGYHFCKSYLFISFIKKIQYRIQFLFIRVLNNLTACFLGFIVFQLLGIVSIVLIKFKR